MARVLACVTLRNAVLPTEMRFVGRPLTRWRNSDQSPSAATRTEALQHFSIRADRETPSGSFFEGDDLGSRVSVIRGSASARARSARCRYAAMGGPIWGAVALCDPGAERQAGKLATRCAVAHAQEVGFRDLSSRYSATPRSRRMREPLGPIWMPAPFFGEFGTALANPPLPSRAGPAQSPLPSAYAAAGDDCVRWRRSHHATSGEAPQRAVMASGSVGYETVFRITLGGLEARIMDIECRAVGAEDLIVLTHVEVDVGMVEGRPSAHAIEFLDADEDSFSAGVVCKMRNHCSGHASPSQTGDVWPHHILVASMMVGDIKTFERMSSGGMDHFDSDGVDIAFLDTGGGDGKPPVLLIHGFASNVETTWVNTGWVTFLTRGRPTASSLSIIVGHGREPEALRTRRLRGSADGRGCTASARSCRCETSECHRLFDGRAHRGIPGVDASRSRPACRLRGPRHQYGAWHGRDGVLSREHSKRRRSTMSQIQRRGRFVSLPSRRKAISRRLRHAFARPRAPITAEMVGEIAVPVLVAGRGTRT